MNTQVPKVLSVRALLIVCLLALLFEGRAAAQPPLTDTLKRYGVAVGNSGVEGAFDAGVEPTIPVAAGAFAVPLAMLVSGTPHERADAAYAFGVLAGRSAKAVPSQDLRSVTQVLMQLMIGTDRRGRIAGARVAGRVLAAPLDTPIDNVQQVPAVVEALFAVLNQPNEAEQLAAMDGLGLLRAASAVTSLTERFTFYQQSGKRSAAGGALEALARIGHPSSVGLVQHIAVDKFATGKDATALAILFARERLLKDGSRAGIQQALNDKSRHNQARGYLNELGAPVP